MDATELTNIWFELKDYLLMPRGNPREGRTFHFNANSESRTIMLSGVTLGQIQDYHHANREVMCMMILQSEIEQVHQDLRAPRNPAKHYNCEMCETRSMLAHIPKKRHPRGYEEHPAHEFNYLRGATWAEVSRSIPGAVIQSGPVYSDYTYQWVQTNGTVIDANTPAPSES